MNSIRHKIAFCICFIVSTGFSQRNTIKYPIIELKDSDTVIVFKIEQGRKLAEFNEERKKLLKVTSIQEKQLSEKDSIINRQQNIIDTHISIENAQSVIMQQQKKQNEMCIEEQKMIKNELKRQKRYKWYAIIGGITTTSFVTWLSIKN